METVDCVRLILFWKSLSLNLGQMPLILSPLGLRTIPLSRPAKAIYFSLVGNLVLIAVIRASFDLQCLSLMIGPDATLAFDLEGHFQGHKGHQGSNKVKTQFESTLKHIIIAFISFKFQVDILHIKVTAWLQRLILIEKCITHFYENPDFLESLCF